MDDHVTNTYYGSTAVPYLCLGIAFTSSGTNGRYDYNIRFNTTGNSPTSEVYNTIDLLERTISFVK